jgi:hypothetical protein
LKELFEFCFEFRLVLNLQFLDNRLQSCWHPLFRLMNVAQAECGMRL